MKITDISPNQNRIQELENLLDNEASSIVGGTGDGKPMLTLRIPMGRNGSSKGCKDYPS